MFFVFKGVVHYGKYNRYLKKIITKNIKRKNFKKIKIAKKSNNKNNQKI